MIEDHDIDRLREIFVTRQECNTITDEIQKDNVKNSTALAVIQQKVETITWIDKTTLAAVIAVIVGAALKLILVG